MLKTSRFCTQNKPVLRPNNTAGTQNNQNCLVASLGLPTGVPVRAAKLPTGTNSGFFDMTDDVLLREDGSCGGFSSIFLNLTAFF